MSIRFIWRSLVFVLTLLFIYLAFPILIVPSSLPAIKSIIVGKNIIQENQLNQEQLANNLDDETDIQIYQLDIPTSLSLPDKINLLINLHHQGWQMIFPKD